MAPRFPFCRPLALRPEPNFGRAELKIVNNVFRIGRAIEAMHLASQFTSLHTNLCSGGHLDLGVLGDGLTVHITAKGRGCLSGERTK